MNIVMMTNTYLPHVGGVARSVETFAEEYRKRGHSTLIVAPTFPVKDGEEEPTEEGVIRLPAIQQFNGSDFSVRLPMTAIMNPVLNEYPANIIHSHHPFLLGDTALRIAADKHAAVIFTHHTLYEQYTHYVPFDSNRMKQFVIDLSTQYANMCDGVIAPSETVAALLKDRGVISPLEVIPTGVDIECFASGNGRKFREQLGISQKAFVIGHVGRLAPEKNLAFLARSVCRVIKAFPKTYFLVVGAGKSEEEIRTIFAHEGLTDMLLMVGQKTGTDLCDAYRSMNVFAFSSFTETQGVVLAEAMAAGLPVVALDASGSREVVRDGKNGFLLPSGADEEAFSLALCRIMENTELRNRLKANARRTAEKFSRGTCAEKALVFYDKIRAETRLERRTLAADPWNSLLNKIKLEWDLISNKARLAINAIFTETPDPTHSDR